MNMEKIIEMKVLADWDKGTIMTKETGRKTPYYAAQAVDAYTTAEALREAAYWILTRAAFIEGQMDTGAGTVEAQTKQMQLDHLPIMSRMEG